MITHSLAAPGYISRNWYRKSLTFRDAWSLGFQRFFAEPNHAFSIGKRYWQASQSQATITQQACIHA
jgi:hypothetical protein